MRPRRIACSVSLWLRMPVSSRASWYAVGGDLHDLDGDHAAQRQAGEREFLGRRLVDHPARGPLPAVEDRERGLAPVGHDDLGHVRQGANCGANRRGEHSRPGTSSKGDLVIFFPRSSSAERSEAAAAIPMAAMKPPSPCPPTYARRDLRLDLFRGLALWFIFLDHMPDNIVSWITVRNYGFSDATEISSSFGLHRGDRLQPHDAEGRLAARRRAHLSPRSGSSTSRTSCCSSPSPRRSPGSRSPATRRR